eukprot:SAG11_NODE_313_length_10878_cov_43.354578_8_plen_179_part_00
MVSDLLLGTSWQPELLAAAQRLAWARVAAPAHACVSAHGGDEGGGVGAAAPSGGSALALPLTVTWHIASLMPRCAPRRVMSLSRRREAERSLAAGQFELALEAWAQILVANGPDDRIEACMRQAEAARWQASQVRATGLSSFVTATLLLVVCLVVHESHTPLDSVRLVPVVGGKGALR